MDEEILKIIKEKGLLLEKEIYDLINSFHDKEAARNFLEQLERVSGQKMITKGVLNKNVAYVKEFVSNLPGGDKSIVEKVFVNLGISLEVRREKIVEVKENSPRPKQDFQVFYSETAPDKKLEVKDFVGHFRARFHQLQRILMARPELQKNLVSINKISSDRTSLSIIGIVTEKRITKNKNLIITFEDLTGEIKALVKFDREEIFEKAEELQLDDIVGVKASGNRDILFVQDVFFPDAFVPEKTKFEEDFSIAFLSDFHTGSGKHLEKSVGKFLDWINSEDETAKKIKYIFFVGDSVDGVGIFPGQENELTLKSMEEQYELFASYLKKIPKRITMFLCPGQHDATWVAEPQPIISKKYAPQLYELENLVLLTNPAMVKLLEKEKEFKVLMYHGASVHVLINEIKELRELKAAKCPAKAVKHLLKRRHLAPSHGVSASIVYTPNGEFDPLVISEVPDVLTTGEMHRADIENYNGVLIIANSCWQAQTSFEEKVGNVPDPCKVPVLNLKTRELKIFDFRDESEVDENGGWKGE
ncbi:MAG: metallophosphoesterase [Nanoarchaeota archaeon]|nr:metallophosphoesterase [Nanoarchaeota archaeon]MBU1104239.1 metallophosphoesterase [Nanoarchaeota archaeon]